MQNQNFGLLLNEAPPPHQGCAYGIKGKRESMEDATIYAQWICNPLEGSHQQYRKPVIVQLYGVFDGHGGKDASVLVSKLLPTFIMQALQCSSLSNKASVKTALVDSFEKMQAYMETFHSQKYQREGTTAVIVLRIKNHIYCANAGDSRAVLCSNRQPEGELGKDLQTADLSNDHKPNNPKEKVRVERLGGFINPSTSGSTPRVRASSQQDKIGLATSRSLGDLESRTKTGEYLVSPTPDITVNVLEKGEKGFIILACDGVWDVVKSPQACGVVMRAQKIKSNTCQALVRHAYAKGSTDNISAIVISL